MAGSGLPSWESFASATDASEAVRAAAFDSMRGPQPPPRLGQPPADPQTPEQKDHYADDRQFWVAREENLLAMGLSPQATRMAQRSPSPAPSPAPSPSPAPAPPSPVSATPSAPRSAPTRTPSPLPPAPTPEVDSAALERFVREKSMEILQTQLAGIMASAQPAEPTPQPVQRPPSPIAPPQPEPQGHEREYQRWLCSFAQRAAALVQSAGDDGPQVVDDAPPVAAPTPALAGAERGVRELLRACAERERTARRLYKQHVVDMQTAAARAQRQAVEAERRTIARLQADARAAAAAATAALGEHSQAAERMWGERVADLETELEAAREELQHQLRRRQEEREGAAQDTEYALYRQRAEGELERARQEEQVQGLRRELAAAEARAEEAAAAAAREVEAQLRPEVQLWHERARAAEDRAAAVEAASAELERRLGKHLEARLEESEERHKQRVAELTVRSSRLEEEFEARTEQARARHEAELRRAREEAGADGDAARRQAAAEVDAVRRAAAEEAAERVRSLKAAHAEELRAAAGQVATLQAEASAAAHEAADLRSQLERARAEVATGQAMLSASADESFAFSGRLQRSGVDLNASTASSTSSAGSAATVESASASGEESARTAYLQRKVRRLEALLAEVSPPGADLERRPPPTLSQGAQAVPLVADAAAQTDDVYVPAAATCVRCGVLDGPGAGACRYHPFLADPADSAYSPDWRRCRDETHTALQRGCVTASAHLFGPPPTFSSGPVIDVDQLDQLLAGEDDRPRSGPPSPIAYTQRRPVGTPKALAGAGERAWQEGLREVSVVSAAAADGQLGEYSRLLDEYLASS